MRPLTVFTIATPTFMPGLAAFVNSLRATGFAGPIVVGTPTPLPAIEAAADVRVVLLDRETLWPGFLKATLVLQHAAEDCAFFDADIVIDRPGFLSTVQGLLEAGPVLAVEGLVAPTDYRRFRWAVRLDAPPARAGAWAYYNGGFFAARMPRDRPLLERLAEATRSVLSETTGYAREGDFAFGDQDVLNAVLQSWDGPIASFQLPDWESAASPLNPFFQLGAFAGAAFYHGTGQKPWTLTAVPPRWSPSAYDRLWYEHAVHRPQPMRVPTAIPPAVRGWLAGHTGWRLLARARWLAHRARRH